jgi:LysR family glycine cleavage system transcriptional activator
MEAGTTTDPTQGLLRVKKRLPSLIAVRYFEVAGRLRSFTAAAAELKVTQSAVSRMIQTLEEQLECRLFERNGRWIFLTPEGANYHKQITAGLHQIDAAGRNFFDSQQKKSLTISTNVGFSLWLISHISDFCAKHPAIQVNIWPEEQKNIVNDSRVQVCIRYGSPPWPDYESTPLLDKAEAGVVCSPHLKQLSRIHEPADLLEGPLLSVAFGDNDPWKDYFEHYGLPIPRQIKSPRFLHVLMMRQAAISGLGFALVPSFLFQQDIRAGLLVQALPHTCAIRHGYHFLYRKGEDINPNINAFKKWLFERLQATISPH